jgi:hypothetical protein
VHGFLCVHCAPVRRWRWTGARWAPVGDARHLRQWLRRLPDAPTSAQRPHQKVFEPAA